MPRRAHSVGVNARPMGVCDCMALAMALAFPGSEAIGTTGVPQSAPVAQSNVSCAPTGNVPMPMSRPEDMGSFTNAEMDWAALSQLTGEPAGAPIGGMVMLNDRSSMMNTATGVDVYVVSVTLASVYLMICSGTSPT